MIEGSAISLTCEDSSEPSSTGLAFGNSVARNGDVFLRDQQAKEEFRAVGRMLVEVLDGLAANGEEGNAKVEAKVKAEAIELCRRFPIYG